MQVTTEKLTPMMRQYFELKREAADSILLFRMGDFYEVFGPDADYVAKSLNIVLTSRANGGGKKIPFCGVPHHSVRSYLVRLLKKGRRIAIAEQLESASETRGLVRRGITRIYSPGTIDDQDFLEDTDENCLMACHEDPASKEWAVAAVDVSTGRLRAGSVQGRTELNRLIARFRPKELLIRRFLEGQFRSELQQVFDDNQIMLSFFSESVLRDTAEAHSSMVSKTLGDLTVKANEPLVNTVLSGLFYYLRCLKVEFNQLRAVETLEDSDRIQLDPIAVRDLELFLTSRRQQAEGSLLETIDKTLTSPGRRSLVSNLKTPFRRHQEIDSRQSMVGSFAGNHLLRGKVRQFLTQVSDLERLAVKLFSTSIKPQHLKRVGTSLLMAEKICTALREDEFLEASFGGLISAVSSLKAFRCRVDESLVGQPSSLGGELGVFKTGYHEELDRLVELARNGQEKILEYQTDLRRQTGISSLKIKQHKTFGAIIEVTRTHLGKVPPEFRRRQSMVNAERYTTDSLEELQIALDSARDDAIQLEERLFSELVDCACELAPGIADVAAGVAEIDLAQALGELACESSYVRPSVSLSGDTELIGSRHPVVEHILGSHRFVANDIHIASNKKQMLITGPNMAGKSTVMRQVALTAILHQIGSFVPATKAVLPVFDQIFTRVGASDDLSQGKSTFMVEMSEAAHILRRATKRSLVILDEVGRGTSTRDGVAIASAILQELSQEINCTTLFATHYHELVEFSAGLGSVSLMTTVVVETSDGIEFTHRLSPGAGSQSFGLEVAKLAGIPEHVIAFAGSLLELQAEATVSCGTSNLVERPQVNVKESGNLTASFASQILEGLERLDISSMTPMDALKHLNDWQNDWSRRQ